MYFKLAVRNVRRQVSSYLIYFITVALTIGLAFTMNNMIYSDLIEQLSDQFSGAYVKPALSIVSFVLCVIMAFVLGYATQFLLRKRKKEFGLYLIMGMTRSDMLSVFAGEIVITFLISTIFGILLGLGIYQAMMAIFSDYISYVYVPQGYSVDGFVWTIVQAVIIFVLASGASLIYLRFAKISSLIQGTEKSGTRMGMYIVWIAILIASIALMIISCIFLVKWVRSNNYYYELINLFIIIVALLAAVFFLPVSLIKVSLCLLSKRSGCSSRGVRRFTVRQVSSRLNSNAIMIGVLSIMLAIAVVGPNILYAKSSTIDVKIDENYLYDIALYSYDAEYTEQLEIIEEYSDIESYCVYKLYKVEKDVDEDGSIEAEWCMEEGEFRELCVLSGYQAPELNDGYLICFKTSGNIFDFIPMEDNYDDTCIGELLCPNQFITDIENIGSYWYVVPDESIHDVSMIRSNLAVYLTSSDYDAVGLYNVLYQDESFGQSIKERDRLEETRMIGLFLLGDLYLSAVLLLLSDAVLALKISSMVSEDWDKYNALWKLGASKGMLRQSLFSQMFLLFFMPFLAPLLLNIPLFSVLQFIFMGSVGNVSASAIIRQLAALFGILLGIFALYLIVSYILSWLDIKHHLRSEKGN